MRSRLVGFGVLFAGFGVLLVAFWFGGDRDLPAIRGLPSPGPLTSWGLPVVRLLHDLCAVATTGSLLAAVLLEDGRSILRRAVPRWALAWAASAAVTVLLTLSDFVGVPVGEALRSGALSTFLLYVPQGLAFLVVYGLTLTITLLTFLRAKPWFLLGLALVALLPPAYAGHSASAADHDFAITSLMVHLTAVTLWVGGLFGLLVFLRKSEQPLAAVRRFSTIALCCYGAVAISGAVNAWVRLGSLSQVFGSRYGLLVVGKVVALVVLGFFGWRHRKSTIVAMEAGVRAPFLRLAGGELVLMAAGMGLAVALSRTPPPPGGDSTHAVLGFDLAPFTAWGLAAEMRLDPLLLLVVVAAGVGYVMGVRRMPSWLRWRTVAWFAGLVVVAYGMVGGVGVYARAIFSVHMVQYALVGTVGPVLLALGMPLALIRRPIRIYPAVAAVAYALPLPLLFLIPLYEISQSVLAVRLLVMIYLAISGAVFFVALRPWAATGVVAGVQVVVAFLLLTGPIQGRAWFPGLELEWLPAAQADQRLGALLYAGLTLVALLGITQPARSRHLEGTPEIHVPYAARKTRTASSA
ncbi:CopD family protein [Acrocarpospora sp. B8E8]|uniref:CopD family protein n=1 Tax=Acrocarpospora sp. B8E8 TaxID=3153572 RepID=UPI00325F83D5